MKLFLKSIRVEIYMAVISVPFVISGVLSFVEVSLCLIAVSLIKLNNIN